MKKKLLYLFLIIAVAAVSLYLYIYKDHRNIATETADFSITVSSLKQEFVANDSIATAKYQDKTIQIAGMLTNIDAENKSITVDEKLFATFTQNLPKELSVNKPIKIKGRFLGYDDLLEEFKMDQTAIVE